eukprot:gene7587-8427_t
MVRNSKLRKLLQLYAKEEEIEVSVIAELKEMLVANNENEILHSISYFEDRYKQRCCFPKEVFTLFRCLASISPVCSYFPTDAHTGIIISEIKSGLIISQHPQKLADLRTTSPILADVILILSNEKLPVPMIQLFSAMEEQVRSASQQQPHLLPNPFFVKH